MARAGALLGLVRWPGAVTAAGNAATCFLLAHRPDSPGGTAAAAGVIAGGALVYSGGVVLNDVADAARDRDIHPGRPIPSGAVTRAAAAWFGAALVVAGVAATAVLAGPGAGALIACAALAAVVYDFVARSWRLAGAAALGVARGANAAAGGAAAIGAAAFLDASRYPTLAQLHPFAILAYTVVLTWVSTLEERRATTVTAGVCAVLLTLTAAAGWPVFGPSAWVESPGIPLLLLVAVLIAAASEAAAPEGPGMGAIVRAGVFGFVLVDAAWLMGARRYEAGFYAILVYVALRLSLLRARS